jgi:PAS domain S-box-containing protein
MRAGAQCGRGLEEALSGILALSLAVHLVAVAWSVWVVVRLRDWRVAFLALMLSLMALRRLLDLTGATEPGRTLGAVPMRAVMDGVVLLISVMAVAAVAFIHRSLASVEKSRHELGLLAQSLEGAATPVLIAEVSPDGGGPVIVFANEAMSALCGYGRDELVGAPVTRVHTGWGDGPTRVATPDGGPAGGETMARRKDGSPYWVNWSVSPVRNRAGRVTHYLSVQQDVTGLKRAEESLNRAMERLRFHVGNAPLGVIEWDLEFRVASWSSGAERIFGWPAGEVLGKRPSDWSIVHPLDEDRVGGVIRRLREGIEPRNTCLNRNFTKDGRVIWCQWSNSVLFDGDGGVDSILSFCEDVTQKHDAEERQRLLMLELDHRVKNNLAMVLGIAQQTIAASPSLEVFAPSFTGRVEALARAHGLLARARWEGVGLRDLCELVLGPCTVGAPERVVLSGPPVRLSAKQGSFMALALHELMVNATKHGAMSLDGGRVRVEWRLEGGGDAGDGPARCLVIEWKEVGGPPVRPPARRGFGTEFLESAAAYELGGLAETDYDPGGVCWRLRIPLESAREGEPERARTIDGGAP